MNSRTKSVSALESFDGNWLFLGTPSAFGSDSKPILTDYNQNEVISGGSVSSFQTSGSFGVTPSSYPVSEKWTEDPCTPSEFRVEAYLKSNDDRGRIGADRRRRTHGYHRHRSADRSVKAGSHMSVAMTTRSDQSSRSTRPLPREVILCKSDGDLGFSLREISSAMYGQRPVSAFSPTLEVPALQRINVIDPGGQADRAELRSGEYLLEVNGECVTCAPHQYVVHLIKSSPDALKLKIVKGASSSSSAAAAAEVPQQFVKQPASATRLTGGRHLNRKDYDVRSIVHQKSSRNAPDRRQDRGTPRQNHHHYHHLHHQQQYQVHPLPKDEGRRPTTVAVSQDRYLTSSTAGNPPLNTLAKQSKPSVTTVRLSRAIDHDRVVYDCPPRKRAQDAALSVTISESVDHRSARTPSFISRPSSLTADDHQLATVVEPTSGTMIHVEDNQVPDKLNGYAYTEDDHSKIDREEANQDSMKLPNHLENKVEVGRCSSSGTEVTRYSPSSVDANHTYDKLRPIDTPFETDEGYIGNIDGSVDYVAHVVSDGHDEMDFLVMAEKVRQMYLKTKSLSQPNV